MTTPKKIIAPLRSALLAALVVGTAVYLAENNNPVIAGLLVTIPVSLPAIWFIKNDKSSLHDYAWSFMLGFITYCIAVILFYCLLTKFNLKKKKAIIFAMTAWLIMIILVYFVLIKNLGE